MNIILEYITLIFIAIFSYLEALIKLFIPVKRKSVSGDIVLITGSGHGIGRLTALEFAKLQSVLVLWDINKDGIEETAEQCRKLGAKAFTYVVDCSKKNEIYAAAEKVKTTIGDVDILINNAGVVFGVEFLDLQDHQIEKTFEVNILAHFWITKSFLPAMLKKNQGHIATVASVCGHLGLTYLVDYCASKFGAVGFHESMTLELASLGKEGIKTTCLCPVFVNTGFVHDPSTRIWPVLTPEYVAKAFVDGILTNKKMIILPPSVKMYLIMSNFLPQRVISKINSMQDVQFGTKFRSATKMD
ncbi:17-beta-hydroxysteroid dehydrogenase 13-like [Bufo gargarizans]|uniref:17-beta-hydroxysteroid dehydrogenase 13-like n=1 Tax=Bufo gargarizans TaxID=30331 RepID=UPI001CF253ED|nr:17-beta-hydroxysteroid dehydrogenase 13-like [Bufo gargarizans]